MDQRNEIQRPKTKLRFARQLRSAPTSSEEALWEKLRNRQLKGFKFRRQSILYGYIADFYCPERKLVVEVDGPIHQARRDWDAKRDQVLKDAGLTVVRFTSFGRAAQKVIHSPLGK